MLQVKLTRVVTIVTVCSGLAVASTASPRPSLSFPWANGLTERLRRMGSFFCIISLRGGAQPCKAADT